MYSSRGGCREVDANCACGLGSRLLGDVVK